MKRNSFVRVALFAAFFTILAAGASAQVTIGGGFALSSMSAEFGSVSLDGEIGFGGNVYADYLLPIGVPLSLGFETGYNTASIGEILILGGKITGYAIPLLLRVAYHFDFMENLDFYVLGKIGYVLGGGKLDSESESGFNGIGFGFNAGAAYYFTSRFGAFAEAGFDRYNGKKKFDKYSITIPFTRFVAVGVSTKF
jgi:hypothetical protein